MSETAERLERRPALFRRPEKIPIVPTWLSACCLAWYAVSQNDTRKAGGSSMQLTAALVTLVALFVVAWPAQAGIFDFLWNSEVTETVVDGGQRSTRTL